MSDNESPPRRKLYDDEEDEEEEEDSEGSEDVENEGSRKKPKRVKQRQKRDALSRFLDIEAKKVRSLKTKTRTTSLGDTTPESTNVVRQKNIVQRNPQKRSLGSWQIDMDEGEEVIVGSQAR